MKHRTAIQLKHLVQDEFYIISYIESNGHKRDRYIRRIIALWRKQKNRINKMVRKVGK